MLGLADGLQGRWLYVRLCSVVIKRGCGASAGVEFKPSGLAVKPDWLDSTLCELLGSLESVGLRHGSMGSHGCSVAI